MTAAPSLPPDGPDPRDVRVAHVLKGGLPTFALPLAGRRDNLTAKAFGQFGNVIGLPTPVIERVLDQVLAATPDLVDLARDGAVAWDPRRRRDLVRTLERRRRDLGG